MARHPRLSAALALAVCLPALGGCIAAAVPIPLGSTTRETPDGGGTIGESAFAGPWDTVSFEMLSWGRPVSSWRIARDGSGSWTETERANGARFDDYTLAVHELAADAAAERRLRAAVDALPYPAPDPREGCREFITDQPYGTVRLVKGANVLEIAYNAGCRDAAYAAFLDRLRAVDGMVAERGAASPVLRRENGSPGGA